MGHYDSSYEYDTDETHCKKYMEKCVQLQSQLQAKEQELVEANRQLKVFDEMTDQDEQWMEKYVKEIEQLTDKIKVLEELIPKAHMAGQHDAGVDPSYSNAQAYAHKVLEDK